MRPVEIFVRRAVGLDDVFGQQVQHPFIARLRRVGSEQVVKAAIFADDNDDMLDRRRGLDGIVRAFSVLGANALRKRKGRQRNAEQAKPARKRYFLHSFLLLDFWKSRQQARYYSATMTRIFRLRDSTGNV